jgi:hypothetical protein
MEMQIADTFVKVTVSLHDGGMQRIRIIKPITGMAMVRFDVDINVFRQTVEICHVMFYKRGDKQHEAEALDSAV